MSFQAQAVNPSHSKTLVDDSLASLLASLPPSEVQTFLGGLDQIPSYVHGGQPSGPLANTGSHQPRPNRRRTRPTQPWHPRARDECRIRLAGRAETLASASGSVCGTHSHG